MLRAKQCKSGLGEGLPVESVAADFATDISLVKSGDSGDHNAARHFTDAAGACHL